MRAFREMRHYIRQNQQFVTHSEMNLVAAKVADLSVQVTGISDWKKKTEKDLNIKDIVRKLTLTLIQEVYYY